MSLGRMSAQEILSPDDRSPQHTDEKTEAPKGTDLPKVSGHQIQDEEG